MANETVVEQLVVRLVGDGSSFHRMVAGVSSDISEIQRDVRSAIGVFATVPKAIGQAFVDVGKDILSSLRPLTSILTPTISAIASRFTGLGSQITNSFGGIGEGVLKNIKGIASSVVSSLGGAFSSLGDVFSTLGNSFSGILKELWGLLPYVGGFLKSVMGIFTDLLGAVVSLGMSVSKAILGTIGTALQVLGSMVASTISGIFSLTSSIVSMGVQLAWTALKASGLVSAITSIVSLGWGAKLYGEMEQATIGFEVMLRKGPQAAQQLVAGMKELANVTPLLTRDVLEAGRVLLQYGLEGENVLPVVKMLGDITGGNSDRFKHMTIAYGQMVAAQRLMGQDLFQMITAGFNPLLQISEKTGISMKELRDQMQKGKISVKMVTDAFIEATAVGGRFHNMMERQSQTLFGLLSTLKDAASWTMVAISESLLKFFDIPAKITQLTAFFNRFTQNWEANFKLLIDWVKDLWNLMAEGGNKAMTFLTNVWNDHVAAWVRSAVEGITVVIGFFANLRDNFKVLSDWMNDNWDTIWKTMTKNAVTLFGNLVKALPPLANAAFQIVTAMAKGVIAAIRPVLHEMAPLLFTASDAFDLAKEEPTNRMTTPVWQKLTPEQRLGAAQELSQRATGPWSGKTFTKESEEVANPSVFSKRTARVNEYTVGDITGALTQAGLSTSNTQDPIQGIMNSVKGAVQTLQNMPSPLEGMEEFKVTKLEGIKTDIDEITKKAKESGNSIRDYLKTIWERLKPPTWVWEPLENKPLKIGVPDVKDGISKAIGDDVKKAKQHLSSLEQSLYGSSKFITEWQAYIRGSRSEDPTSPTNKAAQQPVGLIGANQQFNRAANWVPPINPVIFGGGRMDKVFPMEDNRGWKEILKEIPNEVIKDAINNPPYKEMDNIEEILSQLLALAQSYWKGNSVVLEPAEV